MNRLQKRFYTGPLTCHPGKNSLSKGIKSPRFCHYRCASRTPISSLWLHSLKPIRFQFGPLKRPQHSYPSIETLLTDLSVIHNDARTHANVRSGCKQLYALLGILQRTSNTRAAINIIRFSGKGIDRLVWTQVHRVFNRVFFRNRHDCNPMIRSPTLLNVWLNGDSIRIEVGFNLLFHAGCLAGEQAQPQTRSPHLIQKSVNTKFYSIGYHDIRLVPVTATSTIRHDQPGII
jgi:hypothetical protein